MLERVLLNLRNWFDTEHYFDTFTIEGGSIELPFLVDGQYFRVIGSIFNDGLHRYPATNLINETFTGAVWALSIPSAVVQLAEEINEWQKKNGKAAESPYQSESFGGYSYSKATDSKTGGAVTWERAFSSQLKEWRKI